MIRRIKYLNTISEHLLKVKIICDKCGEPNIIYEYDLNDVVTKQTVLCNNCNSTIIDMEVLEKDPKERLKYHFS